MIINRISTTLLDTWRKYITDVSKYGKSQITDEAMVLAIMRKSMQSKFMFYGSALHAILDEPKLYYNISTDEYIYYKPELFKKPLKYTSKMIAECLEARKEAEGGINEYKAVKEYNVHGQQVTLVGMVDNVKYTTVNEYKTQYGSKPGDFIHDEFPEYDRDTFDEFLFSMQWKVYLDIFEGATSCKYYIFQLIEQAEKEAITFDLFAIAEHEYYPYETMHEEIISELSDLMQFIKEGDLMKYIEYDTNQGIYLCQ